MRNLIFGGIVLILACLTPAYAADDRYARVRVVEGDVQLHSYDGNRSEQITMNTPVMDRDELQTGQGRAEVSFRNGILLRIGDDSAVRFESTYSPMTIQLLQGTLFVDSRIIRSFGEELEIRVADASVYLIDEGNIRVDLGSQGTVRVTSIEGKAEVSSAGRRVLVSSGERTYVDPGNSPESPQTANSERDELDDWNDSRMARYDQPGDSTYDREYYDQDIYYEGNDLSDYGDWRAYGSYGNVWVPNMYDGWRPYYDGRWSYFNNSWFWISAEPWGWAPYHYGRWGWAIDIGWYWIPGYTFAPAWVSWYDYGNYIGWCPLNYYNYPIWYGYGGYGHDYGHGGYPYRPVQKQKTLDINNSWTFVKKQDLGTAIKKTSLKSDDLKVLKLDRIDGKRIMSIPNKQLTSYVMPTTTKHPAYVNDKAIVRQPGDIKNPVGIKHDTEQIETIKKIPSDKPPVKSGKTIGIQPRDWENERKGSVGKPKSIEKPVKNYPSFQRENRSEGSRKTFNDESQPQKFNREEQFKRNPSDSKRHYESYVSPYYRDRQSNESEFDERYSNPRDDRYSDPRADRYSDPRFSDEVSPRYMEEAKKLFERFDDRNRTSRPDVESKSPDRYQGQTTRPESRESYRTPDTKRSGSWGNSNNSRSSSSSGGSRRSSPPPKASPKPPQQKHH